MTEANKGKGMVAAKPEPWEADVVEDIDMEDLMMLKSYYKEDLI